MHRFAIVAFTGSVLAVLSLSACTMGENDSVPLPMPTNSQALASLTVFTDSVLLGSQARPSATAHTDDVLAAGDRIEVDAAGLVAAKFADGALVRVGADSTVSFDRVTQDAVALTADAGRFWFAGGELQPGHEYVLTTPVGAIATADATFALACESPISCDLVVIDGTVTVSPVVGDPVTLTAYQRLVIGAGAPATPAIYPLDGMLRDDWVAMNLALDGATTNRTIDVSVPSVVAAASLAGTWSINTVILRSGDPANPPGTKTHRDWEFAQASCANECVVALTRSFGAIGQAANQTITEDLTYTGDGFRAHVEYRNDCTAADGTVLAANYFFQTNDYELRTAAVQLRNGMPTAVTLEGTATSTTSYAREPLVSGCYVNSITPVVQSVVGSLVTPAASAIRAEVPVALPAPKPVERPISGSIADSPDAPSVFSSLPTAQDLDLTPVKVAATMALALILLLIVGYPAQLLNSTISQNHERLFGWTSRLNRQFMSIRGRFKSISRRVAIFLGIVAASMIAAFVDPGFGLNPASGRLLASVAVSFLVDSLCAWILIAAIVRRMDANAHPTVRFRYSSLVIVAAAVIFSRLTGFEPGMVFGMVVGLTLGVTLAKRNQASLTLIGLGYAAGVSILSWGVFSILTPIFGADPGFVGVFILETLSAFAVGGFASLPIVLLPMAVLDGGKLWAWRKLAWIISYAAGLFVFLLILLPLPSSWGTTNTPFASWLVIYIGFGAFAILFWAYFRFRYPTADGTVSPVSASTATSGEDVPQRAESPVG